MVKYRLYLDKDKESIWLNEMADKGFAMTGFYGGFYKFEQCEKGEYAYQIDFKQNFFSVPEDYREIMEESGIEIVDTWGFWVFLRRLKSKGEFELYTDIDSKIEHYKKILMLLKKVTIIEILCMFTEVYCAARSESIAIWGIAVFIIAVVMSFIKITLHTSDKISKLNERKTGIKEPYNRNISGFLIVGLFVNGGAMMVDDYFSEPIVMSIRILAIILMLVGVYRTMRWQAES